MMQDVQHLTAPVHPSLMIVLQRAFHHRTGSVASNLYGGHRTPFPIETQDGQRYDLDVHYDEGRWTGKMTDAAGVVIDEFDLHELTHAVERINNLLHAHYKIPVFLES